MKFAKKLRSQIEAMPEWKDRFLSYKRLKQLLKTNVEPDVFLKDLIGQVLKLNEFYCDQEEDFVILLKETGREAELSLASGNTHQQLLVCRALVLLHGQMVLLTNYSFLNFTGLVKILKKHDKRTDPSRALLRPALVQWIHRQPFCRTDIIGKLIYECERHLGLLQVEQLTGQHRQDEKMEIVRRSTWVALQTIHHLKTHSSTRGPTSLSGG